MNPESPVSKVVARLRVQHPGKTEELFEIHPGQTLRIGRHNENDLIISDTKVSRYHAILSASKSGIVISDLSSLNGSFINGKRITAPVTLSSGDILLIGETSIGVELPRSKGVEDSIGITQAAEMQVVSVTVLLADVCSYTYLSEHLPAAEVTTMLQTWFNMVSAIVEAHGGIIDKYIGDCVMALWGQGQSDSVADARAAVQAGLLILERTAELAGTSAWQKYEVTTPWRCKISINTGEALMGPIGQGVARDYTVLGDSINVAFRLDSICSKSGYQFVCTGETAKLIGDSFPLKSLGEEVLEGKTAAVQLFTIA